MTSVTTADFRADPKAAMQAAGIDSTQIPADVVTLLAGLSDAEFDVLTKVGNELPTDEFSMSMNAGKIFFY